MLTMATASEITSDSFLVAHAEKANRKKEMKDSNSRERNEEMPDTSLQVAPRSAAMQRQQESADLFTPQSFAEAMEFAKVLSDSGMVPKAYAGKPAAIIASWQHGRELGVGLFQALNGISNINGNVAVYGDLGWALVQNHPDFVDSIEEVTESYAVCTLKRRGRTDKTWKYTIDMAKQNDLLGKDNWKKNPRRMLQWRARSWAMRDQFPDALKGMVIYEEAQDYAGGPTIDAQPAKSDAKTVITEEKAPEPAISLQEAAEFYRAYKWSGWTADQSKEFLKEKLGIESQDSRQILAKDYAKAMEWAKTKAPVRKEAEEAFVVLGWTTEECQKLLDDHKQNWTEVRDVLSKKVEERDAQER